MHKSVLLKPVVIATLILLIAPGTINSVEGRLKAPRWVKKTATVVVHPASILAPAAKPFINKAAKASRIDPDAVNKAGELVTNPMPTTTGVLVKTIKATVKNTEAQIIATQQFAQAVVAGHISKMGEALARFQDAEFRNELNPSVVYTVQLATSLIPMVDRDSYMERPDLIPVSPDSQEEVRPGIIVYINGICTTKNGALTEARILANRLHRQVCLLYNETHGDKSDILEAVYDRAWSLTQAGGLSLVPGKTVSQANKATRQLTYLLFHADTPVALVTYSQGCLIARNALMAASRMRGDGYPERLVSWVALGIPLRDDEILVKPGKFHAFGNKNDFVAEGLGLRLFGSGDLKNLKSGHAPFLQYVEYVKEHDLF
jgi:hypothetical protein